MKKYAWVLLALLSVTPAFAYEVTDPNHLLDQLDTYLAGSNFTSAYQVGDVADYTRLAKDCSVQCSPPQNGVITGCGAMCTNVNEPMYRKVTAAASNQATLELDDGTTESWTLDQYNQLHGNSVRYIANQLNFGIDATLQASELNDKPYTLPSGAVIQAKEIVFLMQIPNQSPYKVRFSVSKDVPFAGQILQMAAFGQWMYKLQNYSRPAAQ